MKVFNRVSRGEMPPREEGRLPPELRTAVLDVLGAGLMAAGRERQRRDGRAIHRRLNRTEYVTTIHDLLEIETPLAELLPKDGTSGRFDTIGAALDLSEPHMERYLEAATLALADATVSTPRPTTVTLRTDFNEDCRDEGHPGFLTTQWTHSPEGFLAARRDGANRTQCVLGSWAPPVPGGRFRHGRHLAHDPKNPPPLCNLRVQMLHELGVEVPRVASSTSETLAGLAT